MSVTLTRDPLTAAAPYVVDTSLSPFARLRPIDLRSVRLTDSFWAPRRERVHRVTLPTQYEHLEETGRLDNFRRAAGRMPGEFEGRNFNDSDVYKWLEAASWILATEDDRALIDRVDETIAIVAAAQGEDGYLDTYFTGERAGERWTDLKWAHEMYCAGHLIQAAVAHHRATGSRALLEVAIRLADHICRTFGPDARPGADGHPEIEMALVELGRDTGDTRYLRQAQFFIAQRGHKPPYISGEPYAQDHAPFCEQCEVVGHGVRALYLYAGATDVYDETGEENLRRTLDALWDDLQAHKIYITGGVGSRYDDEAVGDAYELPNRMAYAETCAAIAEVMWNWRMLLTSGEARFADAMETALYNGLLSGISIEGDTYFYQNPLSDRGSHRRRPWFRVACCPPNVARLLASLPGYVYAASEGDLWVNLYVSSEVRLPGARDVTVRQRTSYPWDGGVTLTVETGEPREFNLMLRIPAWCRGASLRINGEEFGGPLTPGSYVRLGREWRNGDTVELHLPMPVQLMMSHPHVMNNRGRVAITRGPLVYCLEQADNPDADVWDIMIDPAKEWAESFEPDLLGGVAVLRSTGEVATEGAPELLYAPYRPPSAETRSVPITAIPYYSWANREAGPMVTWVSLAQ